MVNLTVYKIFHFFIINPHHIGVAIFQDLRIPLLTFSLQRSKVYYSIFLEHLIRFKEYGEAETSRRGIRSLLSVTNTQHDLISFGIGVIIILSQFLIIASLFQGINKDAEVAIAIQ